MFGRRRSKGHYNNQQYNTGVRTPSASVAGTAAANSVYLKNLGSSAAAEALRRHSLDQSGANAIRNFQMSETQPYMQQGRSAAPRRANSLSGGRTYSLSSLSNQRTGWTPNRQRASSYGSVSSGRSTHGTSTQLYPQTHAPGWSGSPAISRSIQPVVRRNSLTGGRTNSLTRTHTVVNRDSQGRTLSLTTTTVRQLGSFEIVNTKEVPIASPSSRGGSSLYRFQPPHFASGAESIHSLDSELVGIQEEPEDINLRERLERLSDPVYEEDELQFEKAVHKDHRSEAAAPAKICSIENKPESDGNVKENALTPSPAAHKAEDNSSSPAESFKTPSPPTPKASNITSAVSHGVTEPAHREMSPARSALKNGGNGAKTKVSFAGAEEPYVYESYEYDDKDVRYKLDNNPTGGVGPSTGLLAAAAASRNRSSQFTVPTAVSKRHGLPPAQTVQKRASINSLTGARSSVSRSNSSYMPYPHARPWDVTSSNNSSQEHFSDAYSTLSEIPVPERSSARSNKPNNASINHSSREDQTHAQLHSKAAALAQAQFISQPSGHGQSLASQYYKANPSLKGANGGVSSPHLYHELLNDDASSIKSDSSFQRERKRGGTTALGHMKSLRKTNAPSLRNKNKDGRKGSLLNQAPPNLDPGLTGGVNYSQTPSSPTGGSFRKFSLRNTPRPDPSTLLGGNSRSGQFRSRITDSDSEDEDVNQGIFKRGKSSKKNLRNGGKPTFFSPNNDVKDLFRSKKDPDSISMDSDKPKTKKANFFLRLFGKKSS